MSVERLRCANVQRLQRLRNPDFGDAIGSTDPSLSWASHDMDYGPKTEEHDCSITANAPAAAQRVDQCAVVRARDVVIGLCFGAVPGLGVCSACAENFEMHGKARDV